MGLFSVFKLASDYNKAQKYLKEKDISVDKARRVITSMVKGIDYLKNLRTQLNELITKYNGVVNKLINKLKRRIK
jgi:hypothetical protein